MFATPKGTKNHFQRLESQNKKVLYAALGKTDLIVSKIGFGGYRIHEYSSDHRSALKEALLSGCNLVDTSTNYGDGGSEKLIGEVLSELFTSQSLQREEVVIVTKVGYLQGQLLDQAKKKGPGIPLFPDTVEFQKECWHNISPEFLEYQITQSLRRLNLQSIDILLLHNPEYFLKAGGQREGYYQRIEKAFRHLEAEIRRGRIQHYGVSSNTFPETESRSDFTSLKRIYEIAQGIDKKNGFAVIQLPFNLFESGGVLIKNNGGQTAFDYAAQNGLGVLTNRPFNSIQNDRLVRLTSFPIHDAVEIKGNLHTIVGRALEAELNIVKIYKQSGLHKTDPTVGTSALPRGLSWAHLMRDHLADFDDLLSWKEALTTQIIPSIRQSLNKLSAEHQNEVFIYENVMQELFNLITCDLENLAQQKSEILQEQIHKILPDLEGPQSLSSKMIRVYTAFPQVSSVLVGMRNLSYVHDILANLQDPISDKGAFALLEKMQRHRS